MLNKRTKTNCFTALLVCAGILTSFYSPAVAAGTKSNMDNAIERNAEFIAENFDTLLSSAMINTVAGMNTMKLPRQSTCSTTDPNNTDYTSEEYILQDAEILDSHGDEAGIHALTTGFVLRAVDNGHQYEESADQTVSIRGYTTIYYNKTTSSGITYYCLTDVTGGYKVNDSSAQVTSQSVVYGMTGVSQTQGSVQKSNTYKPTTKSWSKSTGYTSYVHPTEFGAIGATYTINLKRNGGSSWTYSLNNKL